MLYLTQKRIALFLAGLMVAGYLYFMEEPEQPVFEHISTVAAHTGKMPLFYVRPKEKAVTLTFDISWGSKTAPLVLSILKEHGVKATFFLSGPWSKHHPDIVRAIVADGHEIASHGQEHDNFSGMDKAAIVQNIASAHRILKEVSGKEPRFLRPPNGDYDDLSVDTAKELGYETVIWSVDSLDWKNPGAGYMIRRVLKEAFPGAIILFHASDSSKQVHLALPAVIKGLREQGYKLVTLGELYDTGQPVYDDPRGRPDYPPIKPSEFDKAQPAPAT